MTDGDDPVNRVTTDLILRVTEIDRQNYVLFSIFNIRPLGVEGSRVVGLLGMLIYFSIEPELRFWRVFIYIDQDRTDLAPGPQGTAGAE